ncbi:MULTISPECIES: outer membrane lipoprotein carrier protein LolA [Cytobacillus]|jgi:outer membrane lipoprotein-sorting protein|uniref:Sporulation protein n=2 Tax=Cytobacillus oceanisediminis TaxID=665099 RepID=A0A160M644_9BACI|nr:MULTISPECIES: outer membrane lipoprotein carrier protein LolA [Cytobacillus]MBY0157929.1 outer membrane lipoprotein carrier protein LolA [Cytobacillus firmus]AND37879.1 sporulation protein [Cytobacillus oceanisediminis 2691]MBU8732634.1 outer membrane lipoprotein carrier protein LolA [Cytobacillus oceanisediminis]MBU8772759.1 outer membrane lipoprotein carrier protein LolA [Cytobacillus oceanisediminis]MCM3245924.1 outer membrane lipoprotein carrier protein LolA [Cytobacillus oceanisedimini
MKKKWFMLLAGLLVVLALSACGTKSQEDVVKDLNNKLEDIKGYKAEAKMTLQMGTDPQTYDIEVWHKEPDFYRVNLKNAQKEQSQMILRNDDGVFVLTPALNKSFRFQSDWPQNSSQAYLYESLVKDIMEDKEAKFSATKDHYVFETKTRYQNNQMLPVQEIKLKKSDLSPVSVKVMDPDKNALVTVEFSNVKFNASFDKKDFDMQKNMTGAQLEVPVMAEVEDQEFAVKYPQMDMADVKLVDEQEVQTEDGKRVVLTYDGEKSFTLVQEKAAVMPTSSVVTSVKGEPVDLGFTIGALSDNTISWTYQGVDYMIASNDLSPEEMSEIARTVQGEMVK